MRGLLYGFRVVLYVEKRGGKSKHFEEDLKGRTL
jgi:hypothetical protein